MTHDSTKKKITEWYYLFMYFVVCVDVVISVKCFRYV